MKVGLVGAHPAPSVEQITDVHGGRLAAMAGALAARGLEVTVYSVRPRDSGSDAVVTDMGYRVAHLPGPGTTPYASDASLAPILGDFARFLTARLAVDQPDVVHAGSWMYGVAAQLAADRHGIPSVQSLPELSAVVLRRQGRRIGPSSRASFERLLVRTATRVTAPCAEDVAELTELGCRRARISVLPQAVDAELFSSMGRVDDRRDAPRIVLLARELMPHKGIEDVIGALSRLSAAELVVVGGPDPGRLDGDPDVCRLRRVAAGRGVGSRVRFTGRLPLERLPSLLRSADVFVSASWYEPFGLPVVEAMSCGVPVVATAAGGMLDTVINDVTGFLVPPRDPVKLADALGEVLHGGALRRGMGLAGRTRVRSRYGWDRIAAEAQSIYERAVVDAGPHLSASSPTGAEAVGA
ncbi:MAG: hypothetical protein QOH82_3026 [Mycobacterium sp.]|nr:hypothetical protein [Mycobacterium sp.]